MYMHGTSGCVMCMYVATYDIMLCMFSVAYLRNRHVSHVYEDMHMSYSYAFPLQLVCVSYLYNTIESICMYLHHVIHSQSHFFF